VYEKKPVLQPPVAKPEARWGGRHFGEVGRGAEEVGKTGVCNKKKSRSMKRRENSLLKASSGSKKKKMESSNRTDIGKT